MLVFASRRPIRPAARRRLVVLCLASAMLGTILPVPSGPAAAQLAKPARSAEILGTGQLKWQPSTVTIRPGGTVTFKIVGATPHPVGSGPAPPDDDGRFDTAGCQIDKLSRDGASCTVRFQKAGTYPFFCALHFAAGMVGTITVGSGAGGATSGTAAAATSAAGASPLVTAPRAVTPTVQGRPAVYWAGYGLLALGALIGLMTVFAYVCFAPRFRRPWR